MTYQLWTETELALLHTKQPAKTIAAQTGRTLAAVWMQASRRRGEIGYRYPLLCACGGKHYAWGRCRRCYKRELRMEGRER